MKKSEEVPQVVLKQEIAFVDKTTNTGEITVKSLNWQQRTLFRLGLGAGTVAVLGLVYVFGGSIVLVMTPKTFVVSLGALAGLVGVYLLGGFIEGAFGDYVLKKFSRFFGNKK